ncbi:MAG: radical SAM protein [Ketobacter sp.]|nr:radical SAM protein [Ketobacter sp.]
MVVQSTYNVVVPLSNGSEKPRYHALLNVLAGVIDVVDDTVAQELGVFQPSTNRSPNEIAITDLISQNSPAKVSSQSLPPETLDYLDRRGYLFESRAEERRRSLMIYDEMLRFHRKIVRQPMVAIPSYNCDLKCPYCWQRLYHMDSPIMTEEMAKHLFGVLPNFIEVDSPERVDFVVFGGEPLQDIPNLRKRVLQLLALARDAGYSTKIISNGVGLGPSIPYLKDAMDLIQITIDGPAEVHNKRRPHPKTRDSFTPMVEGVTRALEAGIRINVRVNTDLTNLDRLPELSDFAKDQGWLDSKLLRFHLAPVKNHNTRRATPSESVLLNKVLDKVKQDPRMTIYDLTGFPGIKYFQGFKESGLFSLHRFFNCEAQINFFAFDLEGDIYSCWDAAGLKHLAVGRFHPNVTIDNEELGKWRGRTSLDIAGCEGCASSPHCGGGCQFLTLEHKETFLAPNCDSMMEGYAQSIKENASWLIEQAMSGSHAVGFVTVDGVQTAVNKPFGIMDMDDGNNELSVRSG